MSRPPEPLTESSVVVARARRPSTQLGEETIVLDVEAGVYHGLEGVGPNVWKLLQSPVRVGAIRDALTAEYDVDEATCLRDLLALLEDMRTAELIEVCGGERA